MLLKLPTEMNFESGGRGEREPKPLKICFHTFKLLEKLTDFLELFKILICSFCWNWFFSRNTTL